MHYVGWEGTNAFIYLVDAQVYMYVVGIEVVCFFRV